jgi:hypothetical protein
MDFDYMQTLTLQPPYQCWHASRACGQHRSERLAYVVRQFVRKYPQYEGRSAGVYKDVCGILECA